MVHIAHLRVAGELQDIVLPFKKRVVCSMRFNFNKPPSYSKKVVDHTKKPDPDNLSKCMLDAFTTARLIQDDNLVTDLTVCKRYATADHPQGVEVELLAWI